MLTTTKTVMIWLSLYPTDETTRLRLKIAHLVFSWVNFVTIVSNIASQLIYIQNFMRTDFEGALFAFTCAFGSFVCAYFFIMTYMKQCKVRTIFNKLSAIRNDSKYMNGVLLFVRINSKRIKF